MNEWISVNDRLPKKDDWVLIWYSYFRYGSYNRDFYVYGIARYSKNMVCGTVPIG